MHQSSILDPIHSTLTPFLWDKPDSPKPILKPVHAHWIHQHIYSVLEKAGYEDPHHWLHLCLTGSLTTYQFGDDSDVDISMFINSDVLPEWSRAEMIGLMIESTDNVTLPGTPYPLQCFVVGKKLKPSDLYHEGLRSGYDIDKHHWIVPPEHGRDLDIEAQENGSYIWALEMADKMERLLRYEPDKAVDFWHQIHQRRMRDQTAGKGDFSQANIVYKFLSKRGLFPQITQASGEYIAHKASDAALDHQAVLDANAGQDLQGLPGPINVPNYGPLQFHGHAGIQQMANDYNQQYGIQTQHPTDYSRVNPQIAQQIAAEFDRTPHAPNDPDVQAAYGALAQESRQQYDHAIQNGYQFEFYPQGQDPYPDSPREALLDLHHNKHMYVFPSHEGFGAEGDAVGTSDHPMLNDSGVRWNGRPVAHNDLFRAIHDLYGHAKEGVGFRADGEENAFRQHAAMFSPLAQRALTTETRGQNNWINYGPHGEQNQKANTQNTIFAQNRSGLMPEWVGHPDLMKSQPQTFAKVAAFQPITQAEARGNSRPVSYEEFQQLAAEGKAQHDAMAANTSPITGLEANWPALKEHAYQAALQPWGGTTIDSHTGVPLESDGDLYALTAKTPDMRSVSVPENPTPEQFHAAMDHAKHVFRPLLERAGHNLGVFHDDKEGRVDIDPIIVVNSPEEVERLGAYTHAVGGAYHFRTGDGCFPPHVAEQPEMAMS